MERVAFSKILISNRGEIALRIIQTLKKLSVDSVAIYDEREKMSSYVREADEAYSLGTGALKDTFLNKQKITEIALQSGCEAVHPGYGFLSENADFAALCIENKLAFIGPRPDTIEIMGNKARAIDHALAVGLTIIPQLKGSVDEILYEADVDTFPWLVKAAAGGGGKGMHIARQKEELKDILNRSAREAENYFGNNEVYLEKLIEDARHIEVQILADGKGDVVHLFERECSIQRRYQKVVEESPSPSLNDDQRKLIFADAVKLAKSVNYIGAGTVEFLLDKNGKHYFLEMNTRIQVEHPITEMVTGIDIVAEQVSIAAGNSLSDAVRQAKIQGHAIEARLYAEDPSRKFMPSPGKLRTVSFPNIPKTRIDTTITDTCEVFADFDPMLAKIIAQGKDRNESIKKLSHTIEETIIQGVKTNAEFLLNLLQNTKFRSNCLSTSFIENNVGELIRKQISTKKEINEFLVAGTAISLLSKFEKNVQKQYRNFSFWRIHPVIELELNEQVYSVQVLKTSSSQFLFNLDEEFNCEKLDLNARKATLIINGKEQTYSYSWSESNQDLFLSMDHRVFTLKRRDFLIQKTYSSSRNSEIKFKDSIKAPLNGKVIKILASQNGVIEKDATVLIIESMKMENEITLPYKTRIKNIHVKEGQMVSEGDLLIELE